jgi:hypothetical protein
VATGGISKSSKAWVRDDQTVRCGTRREQAGQQQCQGIACARDESAIKLILAPIALAIGQSGADGLDSEQIVGEGQLRSRVGETTSIGNGEFAWQELAHED